MNQKENKMGTMPVFRLLVTMALPMIMSMLVQALYNIVDSIYVSRISENALTAVSLAFPIAELASLVLCVIFFAQTYRTIIKPIPRNGTVIEDCA